MWRTILKEWGRIGRSGSAGRRPLAALLGGVALGLLAAEAGMAVP